MKNSFMLKCTYQMENMLQSANLTESGLWRNIEHVIIINNPKDVEKLEDVLGW